MIKFICKCGKMITVKDSCAGEKGQCPKCHNIVYVPKPANEEVSKKINEMLEFQNKARKKRRISNKSPEESFKAISSPPLFNVPHEESKTVVVTFGLSSKK